MTKYMTEQEMHADDLAAGFHYRTEDGYIASKEDGKLMLFPVYDWNESPLPSAVQQAVMDTQEDIASILQGDFHAPMTRDRSDALRGAWGIDIPLVWSEEAPAEVIEARLEYLRTLQQAKCALENAVRHLEKAAALAANLH